MIRATLYDMNKAERGVSVRCEAVRDSLERMGTIWKGREKSKGRYMQEEQKRTRLVSGGTA